MASACSCPGSWRPPLHLSAEPLVEFVSALTTRLRLSFLCLKFFSAWLHLAWHHPPRAEALVHPCLSPGSAALSPWSRICSLWSLPSASALGLCVAVGSFVFSSLEILGGEARKERFALALLKSKTKPKALKNVLVSKLQRKDVLEMRKEQIKASETCCGERNTKCFV